MSDGNGRAISRAPADASREIKNSDVGGLIARGLADLEYSRPSAVEPALATGRMNDLVYPEVGKPSPWGIVKYVELVDNSGGIARGEGERIHLGVALVDAEADGGVWLDRRRIAALPAGWVPFLSAEPAQRAERYIERLAEEAMLRIYFDLGGERGDLAFRELTDHLAAEFGGIVAANWRAIKRASQIDLFMADLSGLSMLWRCGERGAIRAQDVGDDPVTEVVQYRACAYDQVDKLNLDDKQELMAACENRDGHDHTLRQRLLRVCGVEERLIDAEERLPPNVQSPHLEQLTDKLSEERVRWRSRRRSECDSRVRRAPRRG